MTTIAYKARKLVSDSAMSEEGLIETSVDKLWDINSELSAGISGDLDERALLELLKRTKTPNQFPSAAKICEIPGEFDALLVFNKSKRIFFLNTVEPGGVCEIREKFYAIGSGAKFALAAMSAGASARRAVEIAIQYDPRSGGEIRECVI